MRYALTLGAVGLIRDWRAESRSLRCRGRSEAAGDYAREVETKDKDGSR